MLMKIPDKNGRPVMAEREQSHSPSFSRCAQIYHLRWYCTPCRGRPADSCCLPRAAKRGLRFPSGAYAPTPERYCHGY